MPTHRGAEPPGQNRVRRAKGIAKGLAWLSMVLGGLFYYRQRTASLDSSVLVYALKALAEAFAPLLTAVGAASVLLGLVLHTPFSVLLGVAGALLSGRYIRRVTAPHDGFERAFGPDWQDEMARKLAVRAGDAQVPPMLHRRWMWGQIGRLPRPHLQRDLPFWTVPQTDRALLCDLWRPASGVTASGLGIVYLHPGGWQNLDKDTGTRRIFRYLTAQGHVVMDVAYRLCHETDLWGMLGDVKRAVVWLKRHGPQYGVDPACVVAMGGSAGGHLALLAAYTPNDPALDPEDVRGRDTSVRAVVSYYGPPDLRPFGVPQRHPPREPFISLGRWLGLVTPREYLDMSEVMRKLLGAPMDQVPDRAALMSPISHVGSQCPPTFLVHGSHDRVVPVEDVRRLYRALRSAEVTVVYLELPQVVHAFDLLALDISPAAQAALYDLERFLALML